MKCPICNENMKKKKVAPCFDCGHEESEISELINDEHEYHIFEVFGQEIVLCDFCDADFGSYYPDYFGMSGEFPKDYPLELIKKLTHPK